jgi:hypothetical protein
MDSGLALAGSFRRKSRPDRSRSYSSDGSDELVTAPESINGHEIPGFLMRKSRKSTP